MTNAENKYGLREVTADDPHGEIDVWLERIVEVVNFMLARWHRDFEIIPQWDGPKRLILTAGKKDNGKAILAILGEEAPEALPKSFSELEEIVSFALISNFELDEGWWSEEKESLLEMAAAMKEKKISP